jgi:hypothetical protein
MVRNSGKSIVPFPKQGEIQIKKRVKINIINSNVVNNVAL